MKDTRHFLLWVWRQKRAKGTPGDEPYYPIDTPASRELLQRYQTEAAAIQNLVVVGRLGEYKYYDMDKSVEAALKLPLQ